MAEQYRPKGNGTGGGKSSLGAASEHAAFGFSVQNRKSAQFTGVLQAPSFHDKQVALQTVGGLLLIDGQDLHLDELDIQTGKASISGQIDALGYMKTNKLQKFFKK